MIQFDLPNDQASILKVIGVGGGGGNAVNHMFSQNIDGVNFIICNTDAQAIANSKISNKIQLGPQLTSGLGAGANPEIGRQATEESLEEIRKILEVNTKMAFITAGMGGGTGTGGAPIIAKICKDLGVLTVGIVTTPFAYEGKKRQLQAEEGIKQLKQYVDTLLVISNDKLRHQYGNLKMREAFEKADNVLATAAKCITDVISSTGQINVDFADVCTVMRNGGRAILGNASARGEDRAQQAIEEALNSPLLNDNDIKGAKWILININSAEGEHEFTMDEVEIIQSYLLSHAGESTDVILGLGYDSTLGDQIGITLIATGFENKELFVKPVLKTEEVKEGKIVLSLNEEKIAPVVLKPEAAAPVAVPEEAPVVVAPVDALAPQLVIEEAPIAFSSPMPTLEDFNDTPATENTTAETHFMLLDEAALQAKQEAVAAVVEEEVVPVAEDKGAAAFRSAAQPEEQRVIAAPVTAVNAEAEDNHSRGFLAKPSNIYAEAKTVTAAPVSEENIIEIKIEETAAVEEAAPQMEVIEKPVAIAQELPQEVKEVPQIQASFADEAELQRRKQLERLKKLRDLSFDVNTNDPSSEFENVPAYIRRNMELYNNSSPVESYYSKYEVSGDNKSQGPINSINTFLDGKKPD